MPPPPAEMLPEVGSIVGEKFEVVRLLGEGGMGAVFEARHMVTDKPVALKWLKAVSASQQARVGRFIREAQAAGRVQHPHVVDVYDIGQHGPYYYLVMELLRGEPLSARIGRGPLSVKEAVAVLAPVADALAAAHRKGVIHRDLKPENIFLCCDEDGSLWGPKVLDFGISKVVDDSVSTITQTGAVLGTPNYMSPEQVRGLEQTDHRTDIYSLGIVAYEALAGVVPFDGNSYGAIAVKIATDTLPPLRKLRPDVSEETERVVAKALEKGVGERYQTADEFAKALRALDQRPIPNTSPPTASDRAVPAVVVPALPSAAPLRELAGNVSSLTRAPTRDAAPPAADTVSTPLDAPAPTVGAASTPKLQARRMIHLSLAIIAVLVAGVGAAIALYGTDEPGTGPVTEVPVAPVVTSSPLVVPAAVASEATAAAGNVRNEDHAGNDGNDDHAGNHERGSGEQDGAIETADEAAEPPPSAAAPRRRTSRRRTRGFSGSLSRDDF